MEAERPIRASLREQEVLHKEIHRIEQNLPIHPDEAVS